MKKLYIFIFIFLLLLGGCSKVRESAGVTRKSIDEFQVVENPPLILPPDFNLLPPDQLEENRIDNVDKELAKEILFGLDQNQNQKQKNLSLMNQILTEANALDTSSSIRDEIDKEFSQEVKTKNFFQDKWEDQSEVLDAINESERIRNNKFNGKSLSEVKFIIKKQTKKNKKKKRFFLF